MADFALEGRGIQHGRQGREVRGLLASLARMGFEEKRPQVLAEGLSESR